MRQAQATLHENMGNNMKDPSRLAKPDYISANHMISKQQTGIIPAIVIDSSLFMHCGNCA